MMKNDRVDILLPTAGERMDGLIYQINAILNQSHRRKSLWVLIDHDNPRAIAAQIRARVPQHMSIKLVHVPEEWRGNWGHRPIKYALEELPLCGEWVVTSGDDDSIMPWAIEKMVEGGDGVDMVVGICIPVKRNFDKVPIFLGADIKLGQITGSCCLYRRSALEEVGYDDSTYQADWTLIEKMKERTWRKIESVLFVMPQSFN